MKNRLFQYCFSFAKVIAKAAWVFYDSQCTCSSSTGERPNKAISVSAQQHQQHRL